MADDEVILLVEGIRYGGWKSIRVTRSIESLCGSFALDVSDRWGSVLKEPWPIMENDPCRVEINGQVAIDGYIDTRELGGDAQSRTLGYTGRDRALDLVDCSLLVEDAAVKGHKWTYRNLDIAAFVAKVAEPHGIKVSVQPGLVLKKDPSLVAHPGETSFDAIKRAAASAGVLVVSDGAGGILITRAGTFRAAALVEGRNIKTGRTTFDAKDRFARILVTSQPPGTDEEYGESLRVQAQATDADVDRQNRVLIVRPDKGMDAATAKRRADWEVRNRAAKSATVSITVVGWTQPNGKLWPVNMLTRVQAPRLLGVDGDLLISQVDYTVDDKGGSITQLNLVRPDAFEPEPQTAITSGEGAWKEIAHGALPEPGAKR